MCYPIRIVSTILKVDVRSGKGARCGRSDHAWHAVWTDRPDIRSGAPLRPRSAASAEPRPATDERPDDARDAGGQRLRASSGASRSPSLAVYLSFRHRRVHPLLLLCISAISFSWIEAPYDWAMYAQFPPAIPRMPSWWPLNMTWGGLPLFVPVGYISYFVLPAVTGAALGRWLSAKFGWRRPTRY